MTAAQLLEIGFRNGFQAGAEAAGPFWYWAGALAGFVGWPVSMLLAKLMTAAARWAVRACRRRKS